MCTYGKNVVGTSFLYLCGCQDLCIGGSVAIAMTFLFSK